MNNKRTPNLEKFEFRNLYRNVSIGTASDRYAGWIGQIYSEKRYIGKITRRSKKLGNNNFIEEVLPVESVMEYFQHFSVLELDFTFYQLLLDKNNRPTQSYRVLETYKKYLCDGDKVIIKVPQAVFAIKVWRGGKFAVNPDYLNSDIFTHQFYEPSIDILGNSIKGFILEQEYQTKRNRPPIKEFNESLDRFLSSIPEDDRYHIEIRTESLLSNSYFSILQEHGIGQVISHWTWLPTVLKQFDKSGRRFFNSGNQSIVRLLTPLGMRYEDTYTMAHPFNKFIDGMISQQMIDETVDLMLDAIDKGVNINVLINNRAGGNAPIIAQIISERFLEKHNITERMYTSTASSNSSHP
jgi:uncharacterized protein YecE (DUF72 family)